MTVYAYVLRKKRNSQESELSRIIPLSHYVTDSNDPLRTRTTSKVVKPN